MKAKIKIIIDAGMLILILIQMAYHLTGDSLHGWGGMILFILITLHNIVDRKWYSGLRKGKYTPVRFFHLIVTLIGRRMHMFFTIWSFVLMSVHVGLHWSMVICAVKKRMRTPKHLYQAIARISVLLVAAYGLYAFIARELPQRMFLLTEYVFFDYGESILCCFIDYASVLCLFAWFTYCINIFVRQGRKGLH